MQDLVKQEQFEIEILDRLNTGKVLSGLVFGGGTMLRLCHGLNRFSVDLDFQLAARARAADIRSRIGAALAPYEIRDSADKFHTVLFEIRSNRYPRSLKIEIRKESKHILPEQAIAFSVFSNTQVLLNVVSLKDMMTSKLATLADRKEIRDAFDAEFLLKKGIRFEASESQLMKARDTIRAFKKHDYIAKLGSLLEVEYRRYYASKNFTMLLMRLDEEIQTLKDNRGDAIQGP